MSEMKDMWRCPTPNCGYIYDPDRGDRRHHIPKGTKFEDLPDDWVCPVCGLSYQEYTFRTGRVFRKDYGEYLKALTEQGLITLGDTGCRLTTPRQSSPFRQ